MWGLSEYIVDSDRFEPEEDYGLLAFPCNVCKHRRGKDTDAPCHDCDHNVCRAIPPNAPHERAAAPAATLRADVGGKVDQ